MWGQGAKQECDAGQAGDGRSVEAGSRQGDRGPVMLKQALRKADGLNEQMALLSPEASASESGAPAGGAAVSPGAPIQRIAGTGSPTGSRSAVQRRVGRQAGEDSHASARDACHETELPLDCLKEDIRELHRRRAGVRKGAVRTIAAKAKDTEETRSPQLTLIAGLLAEVAKSVSGGLLTLALSKLKDPIARAVFGFVAESTHAAAESIAEDAIGEALSQAKDPSVAAELFFLGLEQHIEAEAFNSARRLNTELANFADPTKLDGLLELHAVMGDLKESARPLQESETRRAWLVFQARRALGTGSRTQGVAVGADASPGGTTLNVRGAAGVTGVLQVEVDRAQPWEILGATLSGLGGLEALDMRRVPLRDLRLPTRFYITGHLGATTHGIMVNENGRAWYMGHGMDATLYRWGGGARELKPGDTIGPDERDHVDAGLRRLVEALMPQTLGSKLELPPPPASQARR